MRASGLTEFARQTPPPLPNETNPTPVEISHGRDMGPAPSGMIHDFPLSSIDLQQSKTFTPSKKIDGIEKQFYVRCNSHAKGTCQGAKTHIWHGSAAIFREGPIHSLVSALMVLFGGRLRATPLASDENKQEALMKVRAENKWCTPALKGPGVGEASPEDAASTATTTRLHRPLAELISPLLGGTENSRSDEAALDSLIGAADVKWLEGRDRLAPTHEWDTVSRSTATDLQKPAEVPDCGHTAQPGRGEGVFLVQRRAQDNGSGLSRTQHG